MEHIDWLLCAEGKNVSEEELDKPYAWLERIYTKREYDTIHKRADEKGHEALAKARQIEADDEKLFFENLDFIYANREKIYEDVRLKKASPIKFYHRWHFIMVNYIGIYFPVSVMLKIWEKGGWRKECPKCGCLGYQYEVTYGKGYCYCPECNEFFITSAGLEEKRIAEETKKEMFPKAKEPSINSDFSFSIGRHTITLTNEERKEEPPKPKSSFKEMSARWRKEYDEAAKEEVAERARFEMAKKYGEQLAVYLECLGDYELFLKNRFTTPVEDFIERIKKDTVTDDISEEERYLKKIHEALLSVRG